MQIRWGQLLFRSATYAKVQRSAVSSVFHMGLQSFQNGGFWKKQCYAINSFALVGSQAVGSFGLVVVFVGFLQE